MRFWWVNQNQTYRHETQGGYLWSPKRSQGDRFNHFYENMREVSPGDLVFSYCDTLIRAIGVAQSNCYECPKPLEFGSAGRNWEAIGWRVDVRFTELDQPFRPIDKMSVIAPHLPAKYSPLRPNGYGNQAVYLAEVPAPMAHAIGGLIGSEYTSYTALARTVATDERSRAATDAQEMRIWEDHLVQEIESNPVITETDRLALIQARRGQGLFRARVASIEKECRLTGVNQPAHLIASHAKPWRDSNAQERLDGENGLLLTPSIDHLFDRGFISFESNGDLLVSPVAHKPSLQRMGVDTERIVNVGGFTSGQRSFLEFHREQIFLARRCA